MMPTPTSPRAGFSLLELLVAIALTAAIGLLASLFIDSAFLAAQSIAVERSRHTDAALARAQWRDLLLHVHRSALAGEAGRPFAGTPSRVQFASDCPGARGFRTRCVVFAETAVEAGWHGLAFTVRDRSWSLRTDGPVTLRYLDLRSDAAVWIMRWNESERVPAGLALVGERDSLVLRIGVAR